MVPTFVDLQGTVRISGFIFLQNVCIMCIIRGFFVKGFIVDERFVVKEVAILRNGREMTHYVFMCPMPWRFLTKKDQSHASWLMAHHHGLRWNDGMVPYRCNA